MITKLEKNEIFVFGSNLAGRHGAGAAKLALNKFGALYGIGEGLMGQSYAFPTLDENFKQLSVPKLIMARLELRLTCLEHPELTFLLTKVGCGLAGFSEEFIKALFKSPPSNPENLILPEGW